MCARARVFFLANPLRVARAAVAKKNGQLARQKLQTAAEVTAKNQHLFLAKARGAAEAAARLWTVDAPVEGSKKASCMQAQLESTSEG